MGCSKGRGLFHQQHGPFWRCWVICKATPGRWPVARWPHPPRGHFGAPKVFVVIRAAQSPRKAVRWGRRYFSRGAGLVWAGGCRKWQGKDKTVYLLPRCSSERRAPSSSCCSIHRCGASVSNHPLRPTAQPYGHHSHQELQSWFDIYHSASLFPSRHTGAARASSGSSPFIWSARPGEAFSHRAVSHHPSSRWAVPSVQQGIKRMEAWKAVNSAPHCLLWGVSLTWRQSGGHLQGRKCKRRPWWEAEACRLRACWNSYLSSFARKKRREEATALRMGGFYGCTAELK